MNITKAYERRENLSDGELERLLAALNGEVEKYRSHIRSYPPDRMERFGMPFLAGLEARVSEISQLISLRSKQQG